MYLIPLPVHPQNIPWGPETVPSSRAGLKCAAHMAGAQSSFLEANYVFEREIKQKLFSYFRIPKGSRFVVFCTLINPFSSK